MKLYVDDIRDAPDDTWHVARTVTEAIRCIATMDFEVISLDHDISHYNVDAVFDEDGVRTNYNGKITRVRCDETFEPVARYIASLYSERGPRPQVLLHTSNPEGGDRMFHILSAHSIPVIKNYT